MAVLGAKPGYLASQWCKYERHSYRQNLLSAISVFENSVFKEKGICLQSYRQRREKRIQLRAQLY
jgi:hypothetical protein